MAATELEKYAAGYAAEDRPPSGSAGSTEGSRLSLGGGRRRDITVKAGAGKAGGAGDQGGLFTDDMKAQLDAVFGRMETL